MTLCRWPCVSRGALERDWSREERWSTSLSGGWINPWKNSRQVGSCPQGSGWTYFKKQLKPKKNSAPRISSIESWLFIKREFLMSTVSFNPHITSDQPYDLDQLGVWKDSWEDHIHQLETLKTHVFPQLPSTKNGLYTSSSFPGGVTCFACFFLRKSMSASPCSKRKFTNLLFKVKALLGCLTYVPTSF